MGVCGDRGGHRVDAYDTGRERFEVVYDGWAAGSAPLLRVDQLIGSRVAKLFGCKNVATYDSDQGVIDRRGRAFRSLFATGPQHDSPELTGVTFDPSGSRMHFASRRALRSYEASGPGAVYEISGPFRGRTPA